MKCTIIVLVSLLLTAPLCARIRIRPARGDYSWTGNTDVESPGCSTGQPWCVSDVNGVQIAMQVVQTGGTNGTNPAFYFQIISASRNFDVTLPSPPASTPPCSPACNGNPPSPPGMSICPSSATSQNIGAGTPLCAPTTSFAAGNCAPLGLSPWSPLCTGTPPDYLQVNGNVNAVYMTSDSNAGTVTFSIPGNAYGVAFVVECSSSTISDCLQPPVVTLSSPASVQPGDFNGDGHPDLIWQNNATEQVTLWTMTGSGGSDYLNWDWLNLGGEPGWRLVGSADFNGDGVPDLVWQNQSDGGVTVHYYGGPNGTDYQSWNYLRNPGAPGWKVVAVADVDGNGLPDLIWQNSTTNQVTVNYNDYGSNGATFLGRWDWLNIGGEPTGWQVVGAADFDGNGVPDLVWENLYSREVTVHYYGGPGRISDIGWNWLNYGEPGWTVVGVNDLNLDGVPDLVWQHDSTGQVTVNYYGGAGGAVILGWNWLDFTGHLGWNPVVPH